ncbi:UNVERIFIED_CONTAM: hypothetical protein K2H54_066538 [Gekko kuhli]
MGMCAVSVWPRGLSIQGAVGQPDMMSATATAPPLPITALDGTGADHANRGATAPSSSGGEHGGAWLDAPNVNRALAHVVPGGAAAMTGSG